MNKRKSNIEWPLLFTDPEKVGVSSERLSRINPILQKYINHKFAPNFVTLVARHGKIIHYKAQGYMDFETKKTAKVDTIYRLWSNTKPITGVATMICVEDGLLSLDDPVSKYIPAFRNQRVRVQGAQGPMIGTPTVPVIRDITIRDCLRNTTGITTVRRAPLSYMTEFKDILSKAGILASPAATNENIRERLDMLAQLPLESQPGTQFEYQVGYPIVGIILETVTGQTLESFYQKRIFQPLKMRDTSFYLEKNKLDRFPTLYGPVYVKGKWKLIVNEEPAKSEKVLGPKSYFEAGGGGGGVLSTAVDYARFAQMLLNKGELDGVRILARKSVELMTSSHTGDVNLNMSNPGMGFGMGVGVYKGNNPPIHRSIGTFGWSGAAGTTFFVDPREDLFAICFSQVFMHEVMPGNTYQEEFERLVYESLI
jgi:CubicO group peptidase (beta-lactamase class C family)